jgi:hypothetical protein
MGFAPIYGGNPLVRWWVVNFGVLRSVVNIYNTHKPPQGYAIQRCLRLHLSPNRENGRDGRLVVLLVLWTITQAWTLS